MLLLREILRVGIFLPGRATGNPWRDMARCLARSQINFPLARVTRARFLSPLKSNQCLGEVELACQIARQPGTTRDYPGLPGTSLKLGEILTLLTTISTIIVVTVALVDLADKWSSS